MPFPIRNAWLALLLGVAATISAADSQPGAGDPRVADLMVVDCLLPGQIRRLGTRTTYLAARRAVRTTTRDCQIRGGEYVQYDRADLRSALAVWLPQADAGDAEAQIIVGEMFERGLGVAPDYTAAARWYRLAADAGNTRAKINLGHLYETGRGVATDPRAAVDWYRLAAGPAAASSAGITLQQGADAAAARLIAGPELTLVEPQLTATRDIVPVATSRASQLQLVGRVSAAAGLTLLTVNDLPVTPNDLGVFTLPLSLNAAALPVKVVAVDRQGKRSEMQFEVRAPTEGLEPAGYATAPGAPVTDVRFGAYHALIVGNNDYQTLPDLTTPANDAGELARTLRERYGFKTTVLLNASRYQILSALNTLRETLSGDDNLLIYYAGHGELDEVNQRGHWLPVDAERDSTANWIPSTAITDILNIMKARQVLVIADSCYAGALTRSSMTRLGTAMTAAERRHWLRAMAARRSRTVLASGGLAPVLDAGGGQHSVFAKALLQVLRDNGELLDGQRLHREVAARVAYAAANLRFDQVPEYAPIRFAGHEAGEFFLVPQT